LQARADVSAVVPCYRGLATIERALQSIATQTLPPLETLIVDDGNSPGDAAALGAIAEKFAARVIHLPENRGPASARNAGWAQARGRYVALLDADDAWHPRKIEIQHGLMAADPLAVLTSHDMDIVAGAPLWREPPERLALQEHNRLLACIVNPTRTPSYMLRADVPLRFQEGRRHVEDYLLFLQLLLGGERVLHIRWRLGALFKPGVSNRGLSSQLWSMEAGELSCYEELRREGLLPSMTARALQGISLIKFVRRIALVKVVQPLIGR
jgi:glycosyltransferase involved in cell wall biosynthesis